jgi:hypothetical protein
MPCLELAAPGGGANFFTWICVVKSRDFGPLARHTGPQRRREGLPIPQLQADETQVR